MTINVKRVLTKNFVFWGPIGNLIPLLYVIPSFRFFYIFLIIGTLLAMVNCNYKILKRIKNILPICLYMLFSSLYCYFSYDKFISIGDNPLVRFFLLMNFALFLIYIFDYFINLNIAERIKIIFLYIKGYTVSLFAGYIIMIGFYMGTIGMDFIQKVEVLPQMGYGLLRFAPGSYANEYGIVSSFVLSILTLILIRDKKFLEIEFLEISRFKLVVLFSFTIIALFLATTRAAYIAYICSFLYILTYKTNMFYIMRKVVICGIVCFLFLSYIDDNIFNFSTVFITGIESFADKDASAYERIYSIQSGIKEFYDSVLIGTGYGSMPYLHNVYLELLFELGLAGCFLLVLTLIYLLYGRKYKVENVFLRLVTNIGVLHVLWFAASNHNLNHHLTWFVVLLLCMKYS